MEINLTYLRNLLSIREKEVNDMLDKEKVKNLKFLLKNDDIFFRIDIETAIGILDFLGIPKNEILNVYTQLISPTEYKKIPSTYVSLNK